MRRLLRERAKLTQAEVGHRLGVDRSAVCRWENGSRSPRGAALDGYANLLAELAKDGWA